MRKAETEIDMPWTKKRLADVARARLDGARLIVVSNREPVLHVHDDGEIRALTPASGLTTALAPVMEVCQGTWVAHGSGDADRIVVDGHDRVAIPPERPAYLLRRVWLSKEEEEGYYYGFANDAIWPLCHVAHTRPRFKSDHWEQYRQVNRKFADAVLEEAGDGPAVVFVQDYHFALLPRMLREARPDLVIAHFWHIPWPNREAFRICPWGDDILDGLLGSDLLSFHLPYHCANFLNTVERGIEARVDTEHSSVTRGGRRTSVRAYPISIDPGLADEYAPEELRKEERRLRRRLHINGRRLLIGVDRVDYIKGIPERLLAVDELLLRHPELKEKFHFLQVGAPSRTHIPAYRRLQEEIENLVEDIDWRHGTDHWRPIVYLNEQLGPREVHALYRTAAACVVSSLHDGMNLVAKEFVAARGDHRGALVLSRFTGAARELTDALLVNPYDRGELADAMYHALIMPEPEQERRMRRMRGQVRDHNVFRWAGMLLSEAADVLEMRLCQTPLPALLPAWAAVPVMSSTRR
jgi:trehalose 6-phosphate synthase